MTRGPEVSARVIDVLTCTSDELRIYLAGYASGYLHAMQDEDDATDAAFRQGVANVHYLSRFPEKKRWGP